jgi:hypothetical protein
MVSGLVMVAREKRYRQPSLAYALFVACAVSTSPLQNRHRKSAVPPTTPWVWGLTASSVYASLGAFLVGCCGLCRGNGHQRSMYAHECFCRLATRKLHPSSSKPPGRGFLRQLLTWRTYRCPRNRLPHGLWSYDDVWCQHSMPACRFPASLGGCY